jgi:hypothetical protein
VDDRLAETYFTIAGVDPVAWVTVFEDASRGRQFVLAVA